MRRFSIVNTRGHNFVTLSILPRGHCFYCPLVLRDCLMIITNNYSEHVTNIYVQEDWIACHIDVEKTLK